MSALLFDEKLRRNINFTLRLQVRNYIKRYGEGIGTQYALEDIVESILFFWFSNSIEKGYIWTNEQKSIFYIEENSEKLKKRIKEIVEEEVRDLIKRKKVA